MALSLVLLLALFPSLLYVYDSMVPIPRIATQSSCGNHRLICDLDEAKLKIARLESILGETIRDLNAKSLYLKKTEKLNEEMTSEIVRLQSTLLTVKSYSSRADERLNVLEEKVRLLWAASRKNNFELHNLESKAQDAEKRLTMVTSRVQKLSGVVNEQWIQIQHLEQALQIAEMRVWKAKRQVSPPRCKYLKFIKTTFGELLQIFREMLNPSSSDKGHVFGSHVSQVWSQLQRIWLAAKKYHHELQGYIKQEMERNEFTAAIANKEVVFFVASALITFPIMSAWILLSSQFS